VPTCKEWVDGGELQSSSRQHAFRHPACSQVNLVPPQLADWLQLWVHAVKEVPTAAELHARDGVNFGKLV